MHSFLENRILPILLKIGNNVILVAVRNGIAFTLPFIIVGSVFLIIANLPIPGWSDFIGDYAVKLSVPVQATFGVIGLIAAIGISHNLAKHYALDSLTCCCISVAVFVLAQLDSQHKINVDNFGAAGLFSAIILSVLTVYIVRFFIQRKIYIRMPEGVPPAVLQSFISLVPATVCLALVWFVRVILDFDLNAFFTLLLSPLIFGLDTLPGMLILVALISLLWCCGIHGTNVLSGITSPIFLKFIAENTEAYLSNQPIPHINAEGFYNFFICAGGSGATMGLVLAMLLSKSRYYKSIGRVSMGPAIFCINEPVIFGVPMVFNPIMMLPLIVTPMVICTCSWLLMDFGIIGKPVLQIPWTMPPILNAYFATGGNIPAAIWSGCMIIISTVMYYPFFRIMEKKQLLTESQNSATAVTA
ncbi:MULTISPECIES: PTS sugar transporter subunit IIC [Citrobacter]|jgi:PTS system cellobiose-specific IIC component|uniref:PTS sugar transporter subunit IIC n=1 Tax=Citrobacter TaxID=544 RepID=UPI00129979CC|nr:MULTISPECIES: PTS transporter subunit EIIC [Citrobacter]EGT0650894.1 PTS sugar transporter subunit IIC [Citrobacter braakii]MBJ9526718.1 PTS sugar transporter subunit IIC [Citrobacter braakii]MDM3393408.1 PTS transporter subunit EIIC [Citrobacter sp. Cb014]MEB8014045.1 PTS transporter subunit EIIC [Citrobacter braakii]MEB8066097.1 PTS transporter subunit EIIC [Citrobacter braakii]